MDTTARVDTNIKQANTVRYNQRFNYTDTCTKIAARKATRQTSQIEPGRQYISRHLSYCPALYIWGYYRM